MHFYLSSYNFGNEVTQLKAMIPATNKIAYIDNAKDYKGFDEALRIKLRDEHIQQLNQFGFDAEYLDLKDYFDKKPELRTNTKFIYNIVQFCLFDFICYIWTIL
ncbi:MAG: hypothetical protein H0W73_09750 [Bacteroidetes bacterium]|nr:hypothetical protein [Bacteroidota bacterium]